jgi:hypothetical protein
MRTSTILLIFTLLSSLVIASPQKAVKRNKWQILMNLINQEIKTINKVKKKSIGLRYRLIELQSEKIKLWKKKENNNFMKLNINGKKISRKKAFTKTLHFYNQTKKLGLKTLKFTTISKYKAAIYYSLALNSRDYSYDKKEYQYLQNALFHAPKGSEIRYMARTSLAEYYYNNKNYKRAVSLYKVIIKNKDDEWLTKNLFNYGWCLLKTHKFNIAIDTLEEAYSLSKDEYYIDFRDQIMTGLVNFYVLGKQINRGKEFILSQATDKFESLFKYTKKVSSKGYKEESLELISLTESFNIGPKKLSRLVDLRLFQFDFYKQFNNKNKMFSVAKNISSLVLSPEQREEAIIKLAQEVGIQQQIIKSEFTKHDLSYSPSTLNRILGYFSLLQNINKKEKSKYLFYSAETLYSVHEFKKALTNYKKAIKADLINKSKFSLRQKSIDAIFSCIEFSKFSKVDEEVELEYAYNKYLSLWPTGDKAQMIFPKLFTLYLFQKNFSSTQLVINNYTKSYPKDLKVQKGLFNQQMDMLIKSNKTELISKKIALMYKGNLEFSKDDISKSEVILANLLFKKYQLFNREDKKEEAISGYQSVYFKEHYPKSVRADAAFNIGIIQIDLFKSKQSIKWFKRAFKFFSKAQRSERREVLEKVSLRSSLLQDFLNAANIQKVVLEVYCTENLDLNLKTFQDAIIYDLANDYILKSLHTYKKFKHCTNNNTKVIDQYILTHLIHSNHENDVISFSKNKGINSNFKEILASYFERKYWDYNEKNTSKSRRFKNLLKDLKTNSSVLFTKSSLKLSSLKKSYSNFLKNTFKNPQVFKPEEFNKSLELRINGIKPLLEQGEKLLSLAHPEVSIQTYDLMSRLIGTLAKEISLIRVPVQDTNFQKQFSSQMQQVSFNISKQNLKLINRANKFVETNNLFITKHIDTHIGHNILEITDIRMPASSTVSTLDLGE